ncbi:type II toxin-antitoxin system RelB/DinJ family antitoxin [Enterococcus sp. 669A]|uniref:Type II toxin-antitoxin system RelB/DinJ family antitoxin n=1 Tax=Candidatus Enterococcus moelleringii TaxID=2815325 RepID=A0ABS3L611_9ENTE|nr:type II toxin-antitoxin system RelB/DinJ family antitoxin [Enterococcus sp. 669A]MBO1305042.1 type II toxin-antitoxin system RelB/DinJ family antitoxin [Enterococcus sp. 669A]
MKTKERLNVNLDKDLKEETSKVLDELGLDYTTAITMYFKQIVNKKKIPFEISTEKYYSVEEVFGDNWRDRVAELEDEWE